MKFITPPLPCLVTASPSKAHAYYDKATCGFDFEGAKADIKVSGTSIGKFLSAMTKMILTTCRKFLRGA